MREDARYTAAQALMRLEGQNAYSNLLLEGLVRRNRLDARQAAFASALFYTALERLLTLDHILRAYSAKPLEQLSAPVLAALRLGVCQLRYLDGVDDYAAVSESVNLVRELGAARAAGFVNGVLRSYLRAGKPLPPIEGPLEEQLAVEYSCPAWLVGRWLEAYGQEATLRVLNGSLGRPPVYLRANTLRLDAATLCRKLEEEGVSAHPDRELAGCIAVEGRIPVEALPSFQEGLFHVQDRASQLCVAALDPRPGQRVLDLCAAPGGKSFTAAQRMGDQGELVSRDLHENRVRLIRAGAERLGIGCLKASTGDAALFDPTLGKFDRVLCDVPCSGFGVIRRKPEIKYKPFKAVENLPRLQYKILETAANYLKAGGRLVYSTCTLLPEENERVVEAFLRSRPGFVLEDQRTYTGQEDTDGFFVAALSRRED